MMPVCRSHLVASGVTVVPPVSRHGLRVTICPSRAVTIGSGLIDLIATITSENRCARAAAARADSINRCQRLRLNFKISSFCFIEGFVTVYRAMASLVCSKCCPRRASNVMEYQTFLFCHSYSLELDHSVGQDYFLSQSSKLKIICLLSQFSIHEETARVCSESKQQCVFLLIIYSSCRIHISTYVYLEHILLLQVLSRIPCFQSCHSSFSFACIQSG
jgi:hypothetical protein